MKTRENILSEVLDLNREIEEKQQEIINLYKQALQIVDPDDDKTRNSYIYAIKTYTNL